MTISSTNTSQVTQLLSRLAVPDAGTHKGQNGKLLVIGGSELFHGSLIWAAEIASKLVDMVHVASPAEVNNSLMRTRLKEKFWNGIVVPWNKVEEYIDEDDVILIGPGMPRVEGLEAAETPTGEIANTLIARYPEKTWIIDGGALQELDPALLNNHMIITPHQREWERLLQKEATRLRDDMAISEYSKAHGDVTILLKGQVDVVVRGDEVVNVEGGNVGMTKGGTGDVLAGLVAALATDNDLFVAAQAASVINKRAGDALFERVGRFYSASDLLAEIPQVMNQLLG